MSRLIRFERTGGPEVLQWVEADVPPPLAGEVRIRHEAVGVNFIDTYHRSGLYPVPLPSGLGQEAAGVVEALGDVLPPATALPTWAAPLAPIRKSAIFPPICWSSCPTAFPSSRARR